MSKKLLPLSGEHKSGSDKAKTDDHVPGANVGDWVLRRTDVEDNDPY